MADSFGDDKKMQELKNNNINDDDDDNKNLQFPQNSLEAIFTGDVLSEALPYLHVVSIMDKTSVSRKWKEKCDVAINNKGRQGGKKRFLDRGELRDVVERYCNGNRDEVETIAEQYGYPIGKWDVSGVDDFSMVFYNMTTFNEDIGSWDVGNATNMEGMFQWAQSFDQSLSGWNVSNVTNMKKMFFCARAFNGDLSSWDTSGVTNTNMSRMFWGAAAFDGDISSWNASPVIVSMDGLQARGDNMAREWNGRQRRRRGKIIKLIFNIK